MKALLVLCVIIVSNSIFSSNDRQYYTDPQNRLSFNNQGGLINGGVCWWHSRLQRSAFYLATFSPHLAKPGAKELKQILRKLRYMKGTVQIPGFSNFREFSHTYQKDIQKLLNRWQITDGFIYQQWIRGLSGNSSDVHSSKYQRRLDRIYKRFKSVHYLPWVMVQLPGIQSHAYLIVNMIKEVHGYTLDVIDSNQSTKTLRVTRGKTMAIYLGFEADVKKIHKNVLK